MRWFFFVSLAILLSFGCTKPNTIDWEKIFSDGDAAASADNDSAVADDIQPDETFPDDLTDEEVADETGEEEIPDAITEEEEPDSADTAEPEGDGWEPADDEEATPDGEEEIGDDTATPDDDLVDEDLVEADAWEADIVEADTVDVDMVEADTFDDWVPDTTDVQPDLDIVDVDAVDVDTYDDWVPDTADVLPDLDIVDVDTVDVDTVDVDTVDIDMADEDMVEADSIDEDVVPDADLITTLTWAQATDTAGFGYRYLHTSVVFDGKMWVIAGKNGYAGGGTYIVDDVHYSSDGINWTLATASPAFGRIHSPASVVFNGKMWVLGGFSSGGSNLDNVYYSSDGTTWTLATSSPGWTGRYALGAAVYNNKIWVAGGLSWTSSGCTGYSDVWYSSDGTTWTKATASAPWGTRGYPVLQIYDNKMWLIGGIVYQDYAETPKNDVWYSTDGLNWTLATENSGVVAGAGLSSVVYNNKLWVIGDNKAWYSTDGVVWTEAVMNNTFSTRRYHTSVVFNDDIWVMGGNGSETNPRSDVWYGSIP